MLVLTGSQSPADTAGEQDALQAIDALEALGRKTKPHKNTHTIK